MNYIGFSFKEKPFLLFKKHYKWLKSITLSEILIYYYGSF